jgi:ketosteroid isomerase-like protein
MHNSYSSSIHLGVSRHRRIFVSCSTLFSLIFLAILISSPKPAKAQPQPQPPHTPPEPHERRHEERHEIEVVVEQWRQAILHSDATALDALLDDEYMAITASGTIRTKDQTLDAMRTGQLHLTSLTLFDRRVRFYGKTALVTGRIVAAGSNREGDMTGNYRYTQVFVRNLRGNWKIAGFEINRIREPKEHHEHDAEPTGR